MGMLQTGNAGVAVLSAMGRLRRRVAALPLATLALYGLTAYVVAVSLYNLAAAIQYRLAAESLVFGGDQEDPLYELGTSLGFWGTIYFCLNFLLATRWFWIERLFGGMDRVYRLHGWVGKVTLTLVTLHLGLLVVQALPDQTLLASYLVPGMDWGYTLGLVGVILLTGLVVATLWVKLAYQTWLATHQWLGPAYVAGGLHAVVLQGDWYMMLLTAIGGFAWLYSLLYGRFGPRYAGTLAHNRRKGEVNELVIRLARPMAVQPGQFVWMAVQRAAQPLPAERHPFSVSQIVDRSTLRLSAKTLGDYTARLRELQPGDQIAIFGPYGTFGARAQATTQPMIWVAGGIGITPFLSMLHAEAATPRDRSIALVWAVSRAEDAVYDDEIRQLCDAAPHVRFMLHTSATEGRLSAQKLSEALGADMVARARVFLCGPSGMMHALSGQLRRLGKTPQELVSEEFVLR